MITSGNYFLSGSYRFNGREEIQRGNISTNAHGLLYGEITDFTSLGNTPKKVIGIRFDGDGALGLLKLPRELVLCPIIWYLKPLRGSSSNGLCGDYEGVWGVANDMSTDILQVVMVKQRPLVLEDVAEMIPGEVEMTFFRREIMEGFEPLARNAGQTGRINVSLGK